MRIYLVRHGETDANKDKIMQGQSQNLQLNQNGVMQATNLKNKLKDIKFDVCFTSPLIRAWSTAMVIVGDRVEIKEEKLNSNLILEHSYIEIQFTKAQIEEIRNRFDENTLMVMDHFSNLLGDNIFTRSWQVANKESDRHMNRLRYETDIFNNKRLKLMPLIKNLL